MFGPPAEARNLIQQYVTAEAGCKITIRPDTLGHRTRYVRVSTQTAIRPRTFLSTLKRLFEYLIRQGRYAYANPMVHEDFHGAQSLFRRTEIEAFKALHGRPPMPAVSGVDPPFRELRLSENYFRLIDEAWVPKAINDPEFPSLVYETGKRFGWRARELCVARILFESGGRISEVCGLTVGDWSYSQFLNEFTSKNKGSHGLRVKTLRVSHPTVKMLRNYFNDAEGGRLAADLRGVTFSAVERAFRPPRGEMWADVEGLPIFLSRGGTALTAENFRQHYWKPALGTQSIEADPHQARHWFVTNAVRNIMATCRTAEEADYEKRKLIAYMAWRSGEKTLQCYEHSTSRADFAARLDLIHSEMRERERQAGDGEGGRLLISASTEDELPAPVDEDLAFILGEDDE
ncbi:MAG TPA: tyrosine-type recombinase/integrase [Blastocatellia bacterium]|nr:tyrosine-type recombinase/integrase [Blastocatellia bacterium]